MGILIRQNLGYKLVALIASVVLWFYVTGEPSDTPTSTFPVKLVVRNIPDGFTVSHVPKEVTVTAPRGVASSKIKDNNIQAFVDLSGAQIGPNRLPIQTFPASLNGYAITASPEVVTVNLEMILHRYLPVNCVFAKGNTSQPRVVAIDPPKATIQGNRDALNRVARLQVTLPVSVTGDQEGWYSIVPVDSQGLVILGINVFPGSAHVVTTSGQISNSKNGRH